MLDKNMEKESFLKSLQKQIEEIGQLMKAPKGILEGLKEPKRFVKFQIPILMESGKRKVFWGYRSQHSNALGPYKGGIRFHPRVSANEVKALSILMSLKCSLLNLGFGGAKGGVTVDPFKLREKELEQLSRQYVREIFPLIGPEIDIPAPDINTNEKIIAWMVDEYSKLKGEFSPGAFTGKPEKLWGLKGRKEATGFGGVVVLEKLREVFGFEPQKTTLAVQGFGNVGFHFAKFAQKKGYKILALSEADGGIYLKEGLEPEKVLKCKERNGKIAGCYCRGSVCNFKGGKEISNKELLEMDVDVLVPAAIENVIKEDNAPKIKAKYIISMANGPITQKAKEILEKRGKVVIPDILANAGGVIASFFEWRQAKEKKLWEKKEVFFELSKILSKAFDNLWEKSKKEKIPLEKTAFIIALERIIDKENV
jgi:glutamate dehydrogenase/leucine dehydrogenase